MRSLGVMTMSVLVLYVMSACGSGSLAPPEEAAYDFLAAADYSALHEGASVVVMIDDQIVFEEYQNGADADTEIHLHSATKAFWASACAAAMDDGLIAGFDEIVSETITEWQVDNKLSITLLHLLELTSGLSQDVDQIQGLDAEAEDIYQYVIDSLRLNWAPGSRFQYGPSHFYAFGVFLQRKLDMNPLEYLQSRILAPIGVEVAKWAHDLSGNPHIPNGAYLTARNWIQYGRFLLQKGQWEGRSLVSAGRMEQMRIPGGVNPGHGRFLWLNTQDGYSFQEKLKAPEGSPGGFIYHHGHPDMFAALGAGKNRMYMLPALNMVVLRQTANDTDDFVDHDFLAALLEPPTEDDRPEFSPEGNTE